MAAPESSVQEDTPAYMTYDPTPIAATMDENWYKHMTLVGLKMDKTVKDRFMKRVERMLDPKPIDLSKSSHRSKTGSKEYETPENAALHPALRLLKAHGDEFWGENQNDRDKALLEPDIEKGFYWRRDYDRPGSVFRRNLDAIIEKVRARKEAEKAAASAEQEGGSSNKRDATTAGLDDLPSGRQLRTRTKPGGRTDAPGAQEYEPTDPADEQAAMTLLHIANNPKNSSSIDNPTGTAPGTGVEAVQPTVPGRFEANELGGAKKSTRVKKPTGKANTENENESTRATGTRKQKPSEAGDAESSNKGKQKGKGKGRAEPPNASKRSTATGTNTQDGNTEQLTTSMRKQTLLRITSTDRLDLPPVVVPLSDHPEEKWFETLWKEMQLTQEEDVEAIGVAIDALQDGDKSSNADRMRIRNPRSAGYSGDLKSFKAWLSDCYKDEEVRTCGAALDLTLHVKGCSALQRYYEYAPSIPVNGLEYGDGPPRTIPTPEGRLAASRRSNSFERRLRDWRSSDSEA